MVTTEPTKCAREALLARSVEEELQREELTGLPIFCPVDEAHAPLIGQALHLEAVGDHLAHIERRGRGAGAGAGSRCGRPRRQRKLARYRQRIAESDLALTRHRARHHDLERQLSEEEAKD